MPVRQGPTVPLRKLLILLAAVGLLPLGAIGAWSVQTAAQSQRREQEHAALDLARALSGTVDAELDAAVATLSSMARAPAMSRGEFPPFTRSRAPRAQPSRPGSAYSWPTPMRIPCSAPRPPTARRRRRWPTPRAWPRPWRCGAR